MIYLNLTNGLEYLEDDISHLGFCKFVRIQSSHCESKAWNKLLLDLDYNFLFDLAHGERIVLCDCSRKKPFSRAQYQGVELIKYVLNRRWFNKETKAYVNGHDCTSYFSKVYDKLSEEVKLKLDYVKKFISTGVEDIDIVVDCKPSLHDGDFEYFKELLESRN